MTQVHDFYITNKLRVIEIPVGSKRPSATGWPDSNKTPKQVQSILDGRPSQFDKYGWVLDPVHVVIDIDVHAEQANGFAALEKLEHKLGYTLESVCGAIVETPSGGRHYYFTKHAETVFGKVFSEEYPGIDFINGKGKQVVAANSPHPTAQGIYRLSKHGDLTELPADVIEHLVELKKPKAAIPIQFNEANKDLSGDEFNKSSKGLHCIIRELESRGYAVRAFKSHYEFDRPGKTTESSRSGFVGQVSKEGNYKLICFSLSDKYFTPNESITIFHAYALLNTSGDHTEAASMLYDCGFAESRQDANRSMVDLSQFMVDIKTKPDKRPQLDDAAMAPPGLLGDMVSFIRQTARYDLPEVTLASCLAFSGMVLGRRVMAIDDTRPNLYCLSIAESGTGKNHPRQTIKRIMHAAGINIPREGAASATAVARLLSRSPSVVIQIDEAGMAFREMKNTRSPKAELGGLLSELFTSSNGFFSYRAYADSKNETPVDQPHLSINAITTEQQLYVGGFTHEDIEQGLFGRFLLFRPQVMDPPERFDLEVRDVPSGIVEKVKSWWEFTPWDRVANANLLPDHPEPMVIPFSEAAKSRYKSYAMAISEKMASEDTFRKALWRRSKEKTSRLALVHACLRGGYREGIVIDRDSMDWAIAVSNYSTRGMVYDMDHSMVESAYQANVKYFISKVPPDGIDKWQLSRKLRKFRPKERDEIFSDLLVSGVIKVEEVSTGTKPRSIVKLA